MTDSAVTQEPATEAVARAVAAERLTFFSDAVIAIAITLLALELPVPDGSSNHELLHSVAEHRDEYIAFLVSFVVIGAHWRGHHQVFRYVDAVGGRLATVTILWLLTQVVTPYATKVLTEDGGFQVRFIFYAAVQALSGLLFMVMVVQIQRHRLYREGTAPSMFTGSFISTGTFAIAFLISIPVAFVTHWAYACWVLWPLLSRATSFLNDRRRVAPVGA